MTVPNEVGLAASRRACRLAGLPSALVTLGLALSACSSTAELEQIPPNAVELFAPEAVGTDAIRLTWSRSDAEDFGAYQIFVSDVSGSIPAGTATAVVYSASDTTGTVTGLDPYVTYYAVVVVVAQTGLNATSSERSTTTWFHHSTFDDDLDAWAVGTGGGNVDDASHVGWGGNPEGSAKLDGSDFGTSDGQPNSWIFQGFQLPADVTTLSFDSSPHNRAGADSELRVRVVDAQQNSTILLDWAVQGPGVEDQLVFTTFTADLTPLAGSLVTIYFEQGDNDIGINEQRYLDNIIIR